MSAVPHRVIFASFVPHSRRSISFFSDLLVQVTSFKFRQSPQELPIISLERKHSASSDILKIKNPQSALLSNHEVLLHLQKEHAEYEGKDETGRKRRQPSGLSHMLRDVGHHLVTILDRLPSNSVEPQVPLHPDFKYK